MLGVALGGACGLSLACDGSDGGSGGGGGETDGAADVCSSLLAGVPLGGFQYEPGQGIAEGLRTALDTLGLKASTRTTVRRRELPGLLRVDEVVDIVAWKDAANADSTVVVGAYYEGSRDTTDAAGLWPIEVALEALCPILRRDSLPKNLILILTDIRDWRRLRMSARGRSVIRGGADTYTSRLDDEQFPVPFVPMGSPDRPEVSVGLLADIQAAYPAPGASGPLLAVTPDRVEDIAAGAMAIQKVGVVRVQQNANMNRQSRAELTSAASKLIRWAYGSDLFDRLIGHVGGRFQGILAGIRSIASRWGLQLQDILWMLSNALALFVPYFAMRYVLVGPRTRFRQAQKTLVRIKKWEKKNGDLTEPKGKWQKARADHRNAARAGFRRRGSGNGGVGDAGFRAATARFRRWCGHWLRWVGCSFVLTYYLRWRWYFDSTIKNKHKSYYKVMERRRDKHQADRDRARQSMGSLFGDLKSRLTNTLHRNKLALAFGVLSVAIATAVVFWFRGYLAGSEQSRLALLGGYSGMALASVVATYIVARRWEGAAKKRRRQEAAFLREDDNVDNDDDGGENLRASPHHRDALFEVAFGWGVVSVVLLGLTTLEFTSAGDAVTREAFDSQRVNLLILGAGVVLAAREIVAVLSKSDKPVAGEKRERAIEREIIARMTRSIFMRSCRKVYGCGIVMLRRVWLALVYAVLLLVLSAAGYVDMLSASGFAPSGLPPIVLPVYSVTIVTTLIPLVLLFLPDSWGRGRREGDKSSESRTRREKRG